MKAISEAFRCGPGGGVVCVSLILMCCGVMADEPASVEQLVAEMNQRIEAITLREKQDGVVPRFNQSKTVACVEASFRVHEEIPVRQHPGSCPAPRPSPLQ